MQTVRPGIDPRTGKWNGDLKAILDLLGESYDVIMNEHVISWKPVSGATRRRKSSSRPYAFTFNVASYGRTHYSDHEMTGNYLDNNLEEDCILFRNIIGASINYRKGHGKGPGAGICCGFSIHTFYAKDVAKYREAEIIFGHPSEEICTIWCAQIHLILRRFTERPTAVKVLVQPFSGKKMSRSIYHTRVWPVFGNAHIVQDISEIHRDGGEELQEVIDQLDLSKYSSVVCVGGDGTVSRAMSALLNKLNRPHGESRERGQRSSYSAPDHTVPLRPCPIPLGIIPTGTVNQVAWSCLGTDDVTTAVICIVLGHYRPVDVCSMSGSTMDCFSCPSYVFNAHFGFFATAVSRVKKLSALGEVKVEAGVLSALKKFDRSRFQCEVEYVASDESCGTPSDGISCRTGCDRCITGITRYTKNIAMDSVMPFDASSNSSTDSDDEKVDKHRSRRATMENGRATSAHISGQFVSASILSLPSPCELAPLGMSKFTHCSDGCLDLVLLDDCGRKQFVRYLKRMGNYKNQLDFPTVKAVRCKEVRFRVVRSNQKPARVKSSESESRKSSLETVEEGADQPAVESDWDSDEDKESNGGETARRDDDANQSTRNGDKMAEKSRTRKLSGAFRRMRMSISRGSSDANRAAVNSSTNNGGRKDRSSSASSSFMWNIDNDLSFCPEEIHFRVHQGLVQIHGCSIPRDYQPAVVKMSCLSVFH